MSERRAALLLIAHGSRRPEANADLDFVAAQLRARGHYPIIQIAFLEIAEPDLEDPVALFHVPDGVRG